MTKYLSMCGILLVQSRDHIPLKQHLATLGKMSPRGPDFSRYKYINNIFVGQTVLHITGDRNYYTDLHENFLAYNGEIYNYQQLGNYGNDIEFVHDCVENDLDRLPQGWGPWAWAWTDGDIVRYATDPQGERCLYQYQDDDLLVVCSEIAPILDYIQVKKIAHPYATRHWAILDQTPYQNIIKITAGHLYQNGLKIKPIDTMWSWINPVQYTNMDDAYEEFKHIWTKVCTLMRPRESAALTYSGGLDSSIILAEIDDLALYTTNMMGKDPIADSVETFLTVQEQQTLNKISVDEPSWAQAFRQIISHSKMPVQSWSFVGQWIVNQHCQQRILFTGAGADELFGGYDIYQKLNFDANRSVSPYSENGHDHIWQSCLQAYDNHAGQATLLMDYWYQIAGCDARGIDVASGAWGIESRNPFLAAPVIKLALNLPFEFKVGATPKPLIRRMFLERWKEKDILPKKGFTGHCNDALPWLELDMMPTGDRDKDWKEIVVKSFYTDSSQ